MAENVKIGVDVNDGGTTKKLVKNVDELRTGLEGAAKAAANIKVPQGQKSATTAGGTAGSRKASEMSEGEYSKLRGAAGITGAGARDFANQAQGLGGLVRLYATYAANVFAVSTAFQALSNAMDTTNMIQGLDQLGASVGKNLGTLSKRIVELTDGAVSLREAMQTAAAASGAGMVSGDIERLTVVAKNASQIMGVSMPDALNRLTRGITKLEPELLDELGLFTKIGPATEAYARSLGKTASQLTDFERRQAFANAVIKEGEDKFKAISLQANPYDKLIASLKDLSQSGLELVNKVLGPIINALSSSPAALTTAVIGLGAAIIKQALPNVGQFKDNLINAANEANTVALKKARDAEEARVKLGQIRVDKLDDLLIDEAAKVGAIEKKITDLKIKEFDKRNKIFQLFQKNADEIQEQDIAKAEKSFSAMETKAKKAALAGASPESIAASKAQLQVAREMIDAQRDVFDAYKRAEVEEVNQRIQREKSKNGYSVLKITMDAAAESQRKATMSGVIANAAYNASLVGIKDATRLAAAEIEASGIKLDKLSKATLSARVGLAALGGALTTFGAVVSKVFFWIGLISGALSLLDMFASKAAKEVAIAEKSIEKLEGTAEGAARTLQYLSDSFSIKAATLDGIKAMSSAILELSSSSRQAIQDVEKAKKAFGTWDSIKDSFFSLFGGGLDKNLADNLTSGIDNALKLLQKSGLNKEFEDSFKAILKVDKLDIASINKAIVALGKEGKLDALIAEFNKLEAAAGNAQTKAVGVQSALADTKLQLEQFIQSTASNDPMFKLGVSFQNLGVALSKALTGTRQELNALFVEIQRNPLISSLLGPEVVGAVIELQGFQEASAKLIEFEGAQDSLITKIKEQQDAIVKLEEERKKAAQNKAGMGVDQDIVNKLKRAREEQAKLQVELQDIQMAGVNLSLEAFTKAKASLLSGMNNAFIKGGDYIKQGLKNGAVEAQLIIDKARVTSLSGEERAKEEGRIRQVEITTRINNIRATLNLITSNERLKASIDAAAAEDAASKAKPGDTRAADISKAATGFTSILESFSKNSKGGISEITVESIDSIIKNYEKSINETLSDVAKQILQQKLLSVSAAVSPQLTALTKAGAEATANQINTSRNIAKGALEDEQKLETLTTRRLAASKELQSVFSAISSEQTSAAIIEAQSLENTQRATAQKRELKTLDNLIADVQKNGSAAEKESELRKLNMQRTLLLSAQAQEDAVATTKQQVDLINFNATMRAKEYELLKDQLATQEAIRQSELEVSQLRENNLANVLGMSQIYMTYLSGRQTVEKAIVDRDAAAAKIRLDFSEKEIAAEEKLAFLKSQVTVDERNVQYAPPGVLDAIAATEASLARQKQLRDNALAQSDVQVAKAKAIADANYEMALAQEKYNKLLENTNILADTLKNTFGEVGARLGDLVSALGEVAVEQEKNTKAVEKAKEQYQLQLSLGELGLDNTKGLEQSKEAIAKAEDKRQKAEQAGQLKVLSATKKLFSEKTAAFKTFAAIEKAYYVFKFAMEAKSMAQELANTAKSIALGIKDLVVNGGKAVTKQLSEGDVYTAMARGAAMAAFVASIVSSFGGDSASIPAPPGGATAEDTQKTQGTAMGFVNGNLQQVRRGVFGDTEAKSESIANSLEIIKKTSVTGLSYDNQVVKLLTSINEGINSAAKGLYRVQGLRTGTQFGTQTGSVSPASFLGISFGTARSTEILDAGLLIEGSLKSLASATADASVSFYETVQTTIKRFLSKSKTSIAQNLKPAEESVLKLFTGIFTDSISLFNNIGGQLGFTTEQISKSIDAVGSISQKISLRGLTGEESVKEVAAVISSILDDVALQLFGSLEQFANFGEGMLETVVRVTDTNKKVVQAIKNITGKNIDDILKVTGTTVTTMVDQAALAINQSLSTERKAIFTGMAAQGESSWAEYSFKSEVELAIDDIRRVLGDTVANQVGENLGSLTQDQLKTLKDAGSVFVEDVIIQVQDGIKTSFNQADLRLASITTTESLVKAAGGLDEFLSYAKYFSENFLTEAQRIAPVREAVVAELDRLGLGFVDTVEEFALAIQKLNPQTDSDTIISLFKIQEDFVKLYGATGKAAKTEELRIQLLKLEGMTTQALNLERQKALDGLTEEEQALQKQIYALQDAAEVRKLDIQLLQAQGRAYDALLQTRNDELRGLTLEQKAKKLLVYAQEDLNKKQDLQLRLLKAVGKVEEARNIERQKELNQYSQSDQALLELIYSYEDAREASDKLKSSLTDTANSIIAQIKQLKDYKTALLAGDKSTLTTIQKYTNARQEVDKLTGIILDTKTTDKDRADAVGKLTGASDAFLELSRALFSSSGSYTRDFNYVTDLLDSTTGSLEDTLTDAEKQLSALETSNTFLESIDSASQTTATLLGKYISSLEAFVTKASTTDQNIVTQIAPAIQQAIAAYSNLTGTTMPTPTGVVAPVSTPTYSSIAEDIVSTATPIAQQNTASQDALYNNFVSGLYGKIGRSGFTTDSSDYTKINETGFNYWLSRLTSGDSLSSVRSAFFDSVKEFMRANPESEATKYIKSLGPLPQYAAGSNYLPDDMVAQVHKGERIIPAPDNEEITRAFTNKDKTNQVLIQEIKRLNQKIDSLERTVAEGAIMNVQATDRNTQQVSRTVQEAGSTAAHTEAIRRRTSIA